MCPVYGAHKQGASYGHTKIASRQVLRKGLSPLASTISTTTSAPVIAGIWLREGKAGSGRGAAAGVQFSLVLAKNPAVTRAIATITEDAWTPVR